MPRGSGRRPKPTKLKKLGGNAGHRELNEKEPAPPVQPPDMPQGLSPLAQKEWKAIVPQLAQIGALSRIDGKALAAYCQSYSRWMQAEQEIVRLGLILEEVILDVDGEEIGTRYKRNPAVSIASDALKLMKSFLIEFGMTPAARTRLRVEVKPSETPEEAYIRRKMEEASAGHVN